MLSLSWTADLYDSQNPVLVVTSPRNIGRISFGNFALNWFIGCCGLPPGSVWINPASGLIDCVVPLFCWGVSFIFFWHVIILSTYLSDSSISSGISSTLNKDKISWSMSPRALNFVTINRLITSKSWTCSPVVSVSSSSMSITFVTFIVTMEHWVPRIARNRINVSFLPSIIVMIVVWFTLQGVCRPTLGAMS